MSALARAADERPLFVPAAGGDCFAVLTLPVAPPNGAAVLLLWGAGPYPSCGRNQIRTRLARRLAAAGYHVVRLDYLGVGESSGEPVAVRFDRPEPADVADVCGWLARHGLDRIVLVSYCFGTRKALAVAHRVPGLEGVALVAGPVRDEDRAQTRARDRTLTWYARRALEPATLRRFVTNPRQRQRYLRWLRARVRRGRAAGDAPTADGAVSPRFLRPLERLVARRVPMLVAYGTGDDFYPDFERARAGRLGTVLDAGGAQVTVRVLDTDVDLQSSLASQDALIEAVSGWLARHPANR